MARHKMTGVAHVSTKTHRLIASRYPPVGVFDDLVADKDELAMAFLLESATNDRLAVLTRRLPLLPENEIVQGPGATMVMAAFLHADDAGGRFTDGRLGAWYAAFEVGTAIAETLHHNTQRLKLSQGVYPVNIQMRELVAGIDCDLTNIRGQQEQHPKLYDLNDYRASQAYGVSLRWPKEGEGANGIVFDSVRKPSGTNVCVFRPSCIKLPVSQADHYEYRWDSAGNVTVLKLTNVAL
jgi:hypothetical protein